MRGRYTAAVVCATLAVVAAVCSHNHAYAPLVAAGLAATGATLAMLHRRAMGRAGQQR